MKKLWFKAKNYGWGWTPSAWQGWLITVFYLVFVLTISFKLDGSDLKTESGIVFFLSILFATLIFLLIAFKTGEKPYWRWGNKPKK